MHGRARRAQQLHHLVGLGLDRAHLREAGQLGVDAEELADAAGGRRVEHHGVVRDLVLVPTAAGPLHRLVDLAGEEHVAHAGRDGGGEVDDAEAVERLPGAPELVVHREVLQQRRLGIDVERVDLAGASVPVGRALGDAALLVGQRVDVEHAGDALAALDLAEEHVATGRGQRQGQRRRDRRLPGAALAGDDVQAHLRPVVGAIGARSHEPRIAIRRRSGRRRF